MQSDLSCLGNEGAEDLRLDILFFTHRQVTHLCAIAFQPEIGIEELYAIFEAEHDAVWERRNKAEVGIPSVFPDTVADQLPAGVDRLAGIGDRLFYQRAQFIRQPLHLWRERGEKFFGRGFGGYKGKLFNVNRERDRFIRVCIIAGWIIPKNDRYISRMDRAERPHIHAFGAGHDGLLRNVVLTDKLDDILIQFRDDVPAITCGRIRWQHKFECFACLNSNELCGVGRPRQCIPYFGCRWEGWGRSGR